MRREHETTVRTLYLCQIPSGNSCPKFMARGRPGNGVGSGPRVPNFDLESWFTFP